MKAAVSTIFPPMKSTVLWARPVSSPRPLLMLPIRLTVRARQIWWRRQEHPRLVVRYGVEKYPQDEIVFIVIKFDQVQKAGLEYIFTDRNAKIAVAKFYRDPKDLDLLRWEVIQSKTWNNTEEDFERKDYKQAEFLIRNEVPVELIHTLVVKTEERKIEIAKLVNEGGSVIPITVARPGKLYF